MPSRIYAVIRLATNSDLDGAKAITEECASALRKRRIFQWNDHYPSREKLAKDIAREELYVLEQRGELLGIVVLTSVMDLEYTAIQWLTPNNRNLYIHRLAVQPQFWGRGYGQQLMDFVQHIAGEEYYASIRLDTFSKNERNQRFYEERGFIRLGSIYFPQKSQDPFYCYEKLLME